MDPAIIAYGAEFERFGIDSVLALSLVSELEKVVGELPKTLMFEYQNIATLAGYFLDNHKEELAKRLLPATTSPHQGSVDRSQIAPSETSAVSLPFIERDLVPRIMRGLSTRDAGRERRHWA